MMRWAITGPTPVISSSFCLSAMLMFILVDCSGVGLGVVEGDGVAVDPEKLDDEGEGV